MTRQVAMVHVLEDGGVAVEESATVGTHSGGHGDG